MNRSLLRRLSTAPPSSSTIQRIQNHRRAVLEHLVSRTEGSPLDETSIRDTILQFIRAGDHQLAGRLLSQVVLQDAPWIDADGRLTSLWFASSEEPDRGKLGLALELIREGRILPGETVQFIMRQALPLILESADVQLMDMWLHIHHTNKERLGEVKQEILEQAISQVYLKRHCWEKIAQLLMQVGRSKQQLPSAGLYVQLFSVPLQMTEIWEQRSWKSMMGGQGALVKGHPGYKELQSRIEQLVREGWRFDRNSCDTLEALMLEWEAPPSFLAFLQSFLPAKEVETKTTETTEEMLDEIKPISESQA